MLTQVSSINNNGLSKKENHAFSETKLPVCTALTVNSSKARVFPIQPLAFCTESVEEPNLLRDENSLNITTRKVQKINLIKGLSLGYFSGALVNLGLSVGFLILRNRITPLGASWASFIAGGTLAGFGIGTAYYVMNFDAFDTCVPG